MAVAAMLVFLFGCSDDEVAAAMFAVAVCFPSQVSAARLLAN